MKAFFYFFKKIDWLYAAPIIILLCLSLAEIYSISLGQGGANTEFFQKQIIFVVVGLAIFFFLALTDFHNFYSYSNYLYLAAVILLISVLLFGKVINGTRGWFGLFGLGLQPVELVKTILIICLARYFSKTSIIAQPLKHLFVTGFFSAILMVLVMLQPDLGSAALLFAVWVIFISAVDIPKKYLLSIAGILLVLFALAWQFAFKDYQRERLMTYLKPSASSSNYNVKQAIIAVGAGGMFGRGLGFGSQSQLKFLPEANTDFIFAVIAEELGFLGVLVVIGCFALLLFRLFSGLARSRNYFGSLIIVGGAGLIFIEMFTNIGMNMGILPVVGIPLPFVSYGGSALVSHLALAGIIHSVTQRTVAKQ
ncbi:MAG: FtsW/RodA/SpoVE family cell cycle protein [Candidatus Falkowbacteria bacterium]|nr:FtsW/RodA/SpoVE family cell cycle protein [Candidatus Falkowbacteria bacterium]